MNTLALRNLVLALTILMLSGIQASRHQRSLDMRLHELNDQYRDLTENLFQALLRRDKAKQILANASKDLANPALKSLRSKAFGQLRVHNAKEMLTNAELEVVSLKRKESAMQKEFQKLGYTNVMDHGKITDQVTL